MLYPTIFAAAFVGFTVAQECCTVPVDSIPTNETEAWCQASRNTCPEICGGVGQLAQNGNLCEPETLEWTCECRNGTKPDMNAYQQSVPGQMCRLWYRNCIEAAAEDLTAENICEETQKERCGNLTTDAGESTSSASSTPTPTGSDDSSDPEATSGTAGADAPADTGAANALNIAREFGTPLLAGGLIALFGFAL